MRSLILATILTSLIGIQQPKIHPSTSLDDLLSGIEITERARFNIHKLFIGPRDVTHLFQFDTNTVSSWRSLSFQNRSFRIKLKSIVEMNSLRDYFSFHDENDHYLNIEFRDFHSNPILQLPGVEVLMLHKIPILYDPNPCDDVKRIFYREVVKGFQVDSQFVSTKQPVSLDSLFVKIRDNTLRPYLRTLQRQNGTAVQMLPCYNDFELLKWLDGDTLTGFEFGEYRLKPSLGAILNTTAMLLSGMDAGYDSSHFSLKMKGFTDPTPVGSIPLQKSQTGIASWSSDHSGMVLDFDNCLAGSQSGPSRYFGIDAVPSVNPFTSISNNCQLGATRAFVACKYFRDQLPGVSLDLSYATGGINNIGGQDSVKRMVSVKLEVDLGRQKK